MLRSACTILLSRNAKLSGDVGPANLKSVFQGHIKKECVCVSVPDEGRKTFKKIMIESRVRRVLADLNEYTNEMLRGDFHERCKGISTNHHNTHHT